jgi:hypothetical protein
MGSMLNSLDAIKIVELVIELVLNLEPIEY